MLGKLLSAALLATASWAVQAEEASFSLSEHSLRGYFAGPLSRLFSGTSGQYDAGVIYRDKDAGLTLAHLGLLATGDIGAKGIEAGAGLGGRVIVADYGHATGAAFALGGQFDLRLPSFERIGLTGYGWFAPGITSFHNIKNYSEFALDVEFEVVRAAAVFAGYRHVSIEPEQGGPSNADSGAHIGLRLKF